jgi:NAD+ diphosphatase
LCDTCPEVYSDSEYLFSIDQQAFFLVMKPTVALAAHCEMHSTQVFRELLPAHMSFAGVTGTQLYRWREHHRYCGRCGGVMEPSKSERAVQCNSCGHRDYPRISPAVIVAVTDGDNLLMGRSAKSQYRRFSLVAGFVEIGETFEGAVEREVMEEVGLKIRNIRYYKSQPWAFSDSIMIGFFAELDGDPVISLNDNELAEARWFSREEIPSPSSSISIASEMIAAFRNRE